MFIIIDSNRFDRFRQNFLPILHRPLIEIVKTASDLMGEFGNIYVPHGLDLCGRCPNVLGSGSNLFIKSPKPFSDICPVSIRFNSAY